MIFVCELVGVKLCVLYVVVLVVGNFVFVFGFYIVCLVDIGLVVVGFWCLVFVLLFLVLIVWVNC